MRNILPIIIACILLIGFLLPRHNTSPVSAVTADHVVISEVQIAGGTSSDEFVELYNPTNSSIDMTGWTLYRKTTSAASAEIAIATPSGSIAAHGFHLIAHQDFDGGVTANTSYTGQNIASNNSVILRDAGSQLMDLVGMGTSETSETTPVLNPIDNRSIERKALSTSTEPDMAPGGAHATFGNGEDTDNNVNDFVRHVSPNVSDPQNASSPTETPAEVTPSVTPTPTEGPTSTPTPTGEPTNTPTPTEELTQTPTPTEEVTSTPTPTPSEEPTGTPTQIPTETPTSTPTPTEEPTETPTPTHTVTP
ncbi:lamin tail domain-containing protein, partial [Candidatus Roizmanbacteria bacterium]|nr:lamin tail domain-containing protein [Candidatus Roizmanbacteria bacterium]